MHFFRRFEAPILAITVLILLSTLALVSFGEGFKSLTLQRKGVTLRKRDGTTITFALPWKSALNTPAEAKGLSHALPGLLEDVTNVASAILDDGSNVANDVASQNNALQSKVVADMPDSATQVSIVFNGGAGVVASVLSEVNSIVNDATGIIGGVVGDATSVLGAVMGGVTSTGAGAGNGQGQGGGQSATATNSITMSEPQEFLPQSHSSAMNITSIATLLPTLTASPGPIGAGSACPSMATTTITPCCPPPSTVTCTVAETWHSTHYESTQTLYSFMSVFTVTCTETISVCLPSNPYLFSQNITAPSSSSPPLITCVNGILAKREEDCPQVSTSSHISNVSSPCSMMVPNSIPYISENPVPFVASLLSSVAATANSSSVICPKGASSVPSTMASFTVSIPSLSSTTSSVPTLASLLASIICADGSLVIRTQDCLNGLPGSTTSSLLEFRTSPAPILSQATTAASNIASNENALLSNMIANAVSALSNVQGLTGDLLTTVMSDVAFALAIANSVTGNVLPAGGSFTVAGPGSAVTGNLVSTVDGVVPSAGSGVASVGNSLPSITGGLLAVAGPGGAAAGNMASTLPGGVGGLAGSGIASASNSIAGNGAAGTGNIVGHLETMVNGIPTLLPIVTTVLSGKPTTVPVVEMPVNGVPTMLPVVNDGEGLLGGLNGGSVVKGRRRTFKRGEGMLLEIQYYCEENADEHPCVLHGDGLGEGVLEKND